MFEATDIFSENQLLPPLCQLAVLDDLEDGLLHQSPLGRVRHHQVSVSTEMGRNSGGRERMSRVEMKEIDEISLL